MRLFLIISFFSAVFLTVSQSVSANSQEQEIEVAYNVSMLRAAPGKMKQLIEAVKTEKKKLGGNLLIMRHSQGDHWDLMLLWPKPKQLAVTQYREWVDFQHDFVASSAASWVALKSVAQRSNLFHIEMFQAANGKYDALLKQRKMENNYLVATQRNANLIFETTFGSDVDLFTLGFYPDMLSFATDPDLPTEEFEKAATDAGFESRADIGFYLRNFLVGHQDTLATRID